jgi:hypothetical protein
MLTFAGRSTYKPSISPQPRLRLLHRHNHAFTLSLARVGIDCRYRHHLTLTPILTVIVTLTVTVELIHPTARLTLTTGAAPSLIAFSTTTHCLCYHYQHDRLHDSMLNIHTSSFHYRVTACATR